MRTLLINIGVLLALLLALLLLPPLVFDAYQWGRKHWVQDPRADLPNYRNVGWAQRHFQEFSKVSTTYFDFIGWRRAPFEGSTIRIDADGYRRHPNGPERAQAAVWVFGGSTTWGPGVDSGNTMPARLQALSGLGSFNFGESAYTAHQSFNLLVKSYLQGGRPQHVVFYDGANEVVIKCRAELGFYSSSHEQTIRERLRSTALSRQFLAPSLELLGRGLRTLAAAEQQDMGYDCHRNEAKRKLIASALVMDWQLARQLAESRGARFLPVLQPISFTGRPYLEHLPGVLAAKALRDQYDAVYPEIRRQLAEAGMPYLDLSDVLDIREPVYIDFAHVSPRGNELIAQGIARRLRVSAD